MENLELEYISRAERVARRNRHKAARQKRHEIHHKKMVIHHKKMVEHRKINKEKAKKFIQKQGFKLLLPFKSIMAKVLKDKGITNDGSISDMATKFYELITGKKVEKLENLNGVEYIIDDIIEIVVKTVIGFFRASKEKKDQLIKENKPVPPMIDKSGTAYVSTYNTVKDAATESVKIESFPYLAIGGGALLFLLMTKKK